MPLAVIDAAELILKFGHGIPRSADQQHHKYFIAHAVNMRIGDQTSGFGHALGEVKQG